MMRLAVLPFPVLLLVAGCGTSRIGHAVPAAAAAPSSAVTSAGAAGAATAPAQDVTTELQQARQHSADLEQQLTQRTQEAEALRAQIEQMQQMQTNLRQALHRFTGDAPEAAGSANDGASASAGGDPAGAAGSVDGAAAGTEQVALRQALTEEQQRRTSAETELERLKAETSAPGYEAPPPANQISQEDFLQVKQEAVELRRALTDERAARERLAQDLQALQARTMETNPPVVADADSNLQAQLAKLQAEKNAAVDSFNRKLAESQQHVSELEHELSSYQTTGATAGDSSNPDLVKLRADNAALADRVEQEHQRTEQLAAKLKMASRITDLIFKMQAQPRPRQALQLQPSPFPDGAH